MMDSSVELVMRKVERIPGGSGNPGYGPMARKVLNELRSVGDPSPRLVAVCPNRNPLDSLARQLRKAEEGITVRVTVLDRDEETLKGTSFGLFAVPPEPF